MYRQRLSLLALLLCFISAAASAETGHYRIDSAASDIHWRVYRAGALSGLGHNHVISASGVSGSVQLETPPQESSFELNIPVAALVVDNPALRSRYGGDFSAQPSAKAVAGTRANMLGDKLLKGDQFPQMQLSGSAVVSSGQQVDIPVTIRILGRSIAVRLPASVEFDGRQLRARGQFALSHRQLGLQPFSAALGALRVAEDIDFSYDIRANRTD